LKAPVKKPHKGMICLDRKSKLYLTLFTSTFYISAVTFGSGYVIIPIMKKRFVDELNWIDEDEMLNLIAVAQSSPGVMTVNASLLIGYRIAGRFGAFVTVLGSVLPPLVTISIVSMFYDAFCDNDIVRAVLMGMQAGVSAVISDVVFKLAANVVKEKQALSLFVMIGAFIATFCLKINVVLIIMFCIILGVLKSLFVKGESGN